MPSSAPPVSLLVREAILLFFDRVLTCVVYFIYPETANVRLEDMNSLFGDATTVMPTPQTLAEAESLFSGHGRGSPEPLDIRNGTGADQAIPGLDIEPPELDDAKSLSKAEGETGEGIGGWISNMVKRTKANGEGDSSSGKYKRVGQDED
jgi:hypothetical protein